MRKIPLQSFESVRDLQNFENIRVKLIEISPKSFVNFPVTSTVNFADDLWVFHEFKRFSGEDWAYKYDFTQLDTTYKNYAKFMILRELFNKQLHFNTVGRKFYTIQHFIHYLSEQQMFYPNLIDTQLLKGFLADTVSERNLTHKKQAIKVFLSEIELRVQGVNYLECYTYLNEINSRKVKFERENGKHKFVPIDMHNKIISLAIQDLRCESLPINQRAGACMIVLVAETGMRIGEFRILEVDRWEGISIVGEPETFYYLNFKTYKTVKEKDFKWTRSFITENALIAYRTLTEIYRERRKTEFLFVNEKGTEVTKSLLRYRLVEFFYRHQNELQFEKLADHDLSQMAVTKKRNYKSARFIPDDEMDRDIYYVTFHQYRVMLATILYNKGYHMDFIRQHMNHLSEEMTQHYIRLKEIEKFEVNAVETLQKRSTIEGSILNTDINETSDRFVKEELQSEEYQDIYERINQFLKKNKLNIFTDIKEIVTKLSRTDNSITDLELGLCAKSFNKLCDRNAYISSINDAYYLGVQIHSLEDLPYSIKRFQEKASIVVHNENLYKNNPKYRNEFEKELKGIKKYIERKLTPELVLLKNKIGEIGLEAIHHNYPGLTEITGGLAAIEKEVRNWRNKTLEPQLKNA